MEDPLTVRAAHQMSALVGCICGDVETIGKAIATLSYINSRVPSASLLPYQRPACLVSSTHLSASTKY